MTSDVHDYGVHYKSALSTPPAARAEIDQLPERESVLLVEDERVTRKAMALLLAASGYPTQSAGSAEEALRLIDQHGVPHIALVDLDLPGMNGLELIRRLEQADPSLVPVLITAVGDDALISVLRERGVKYLRKPVEFNSLLELLGEQRPRH